MNVRTTGETLADVPGAALNAAPSETEPIAHGAAREPEVVTRQHTRIGLLGASGYSGQEFARLALRHPGLELAVMFSRERAGRPASETLPGIDPRVHVMPDFVHPDELSSRLEAGEFDTLVACLPHGEWAKFSAATPAVNAVARVVDLSADFRDGTQAYVYGLPEAFRDALPNASRIANPGCYPTAATLALMPALEAGWLGGPIMVSALSGVSGAGRVPSLRTSFVELDGGAALYHAGTTHAHVAEMERGLSRLAGGTVEVGFAPQLAPMARGILLTATVPLAHPVTAADARALYLERYQGEPFVRVLAPEDWPETRAVRTSNRCDIAVTTMHGGRVLLATAALDNLVKGAAGQAIQNLNLMLGWPEDWGLPKHGNPW